MGIESPKFETPKEITAEELEKFEGLEYEEEKKKYDPLHNFIREKMGLDPGRDVGLEYVLMKKIIDPDNPEKFKLEKEDFSNYHDFLKFRKQLSEEEKKELDGDYTQKGFLGQEIKIKSPTILAYEEFWNRLNNPEDELYKYRDSFFELRGKASREELENEYAKAVERGEVKEIKPEEKIEEKPEEIEKEKAEIEKEKTPEELQLDEKRQSYAESYIAYRKAFGGMKEKDLKAFEKTIESVREYIQPGDSEKLKSEDREAKENIEAELRKQNFISDLEEKGINFLKAEAIYNAELKKAEYENTRNEIAQKMKESGIDNAEIFNKLFLNEKELLNQAKVESWPPKEKNLFMKGMEKWMKLPTAVRLLISTGIVTGAVAATGGFSAAAAATYAGYRYIRGFGSVLVGKLAGKGVDRVLSRGIEASKDAAISKLREGFDLKNLKETEKELEKIFEETAKKERRKRLISGAASLVAGVGTSIGMGMLEKAWAGSIKTGIHDSPTPKPRAEIPQEPETPPETPLKTPIEAIPQKPSIESVIEVQKGDSVWKLAAKQLEERYGNKFTGLDEARKTYVIDAIKDKVSADPGKFGLTNVDQLNIGQKVDLSSVFEDKTDIDNIFNSADNLTQPQLENVLHNNSEILNWVKAHPHEALTSEKVEQILHPKAPEILVTETTAPELPPDLQPPFSPEVQEGIEQKIDSFSENPLEIPVDDKTMDILNSGTTEKIFENLPSEITRNIITEKIHDNFGLWSGTYDKFSDMKLKDFFNLTNENDAHYMTGTPWEDYKYHEISRVQDQAEKVFKALDTTEQDVVGKGNVESFLKKYFVKVFSK